MFTKSQYNTKKLNITFFAERYIPHSLPMKEYFKLRGIYLASDVWSTPIEMRYKFRNIVLFVLVWDTEDRGILSNAPYGYEKIGIQ